MARDAGDVRDKEANIVRDRFAEVLRCSRDAHIRGVKGATWCGGGGDRDRVRRARCCKARRCACYFVLVDDLDAGAHVAAGADGNGEISSGVREVRPPDGELLVPCDSATLSVGTDRKGDCEGADHGKNGVVEWLERGFPKVALGRVPGALAAPHQKPCGDRVDDRSEGAASRPGPAARSACNDAPNKASIEGELDGVEVDFCLGPSPQEQ